MSLKLAYWSTCVILLAVRASCTVQATRRKPISELFTGHDEALKSDTLQWKPLQEVEELIRVRRQSSGVPQIHGEYQFNDNNNYASIHYSGSSSPVILVLTFRFSNSAGFLGNSNLYRSADYGAHFSPIEDELDTTQPNPSLWRNFYVSSLTNLVILFSATQPRFYSSTNDGATWSIQIISPSTIDPTSLIWNPVNDRMALGHDPQFNQLYVTQDLGQTWTKIAENVELASDYQWGDAAYDEDASVVYFNTNDPNDATEQVSLLTQRVPFNSNTQQEFDPNLGRHDDFLLLGPYIFAQKRDPQGVISLYVSYNRQPFRQALIPSTDPHQNYIVSHIDEQQASVIVEHSSGQYNLYLSDITGVYFSLSLPDIVVEVNSGIDLELIEGVNGTLVANQHLRNNPVAASDTIRTLISLDNGGNWEYVRSPASANCNPPQCSLHFHMTTSEYARTGVYSQASAPGLILAHGNTGSTLNDQSPDLYISRDGGVSWSLTLQGSWGVTVVDHGGLLVAARDYHQAPSTELRYSCDEGLSWRDFVFSTSGMTVFGVLTEPGEHTTTVSLYGLKQGSATWDVVTVNFSSIFPSICSPSDYYLWHPWDDRTGEDCILGSSVTIERRNASICCLIGQDYSRPSNFFVCPCFDDDFECDYGYMRSEGFTGSCVRDAIVSLPPASCANGSVSFFESRGYRKVPGDVCTGGVERALEPVERPCCGDNDPCQSRCVSGISTCHFFSSGYDCLCDPGYSKNSSQPFAACVDVDECASSAACSALATCVNTVGSFMCTCNPGYRGDGFNCYNSNECLLSAPPCDTLATCADTAGSYECTCLPGYTGNGLTSGSGCTDVDECAHTPCDDNAQCTNVVGSFQCVCNEGFIGSGIECYNGQNPCSDLTCGSRAQCVYDRVTGFRCVCGYGLVVNTSSGGCHVPLNGCDVSSPCTGDATCSVVQDAYECQCKPGYSGDGLTECTNINECSSQPCVGDATCSDTDGSFFCRCKSGFLGDGLASGTGCGASAGAAKSSGPPIAVIVVSILLAVTLAALLVLGVVACRLHYSLKQYRGSSSRSVGGIHYRTTATDDPVTWSAPPEDDDDDPLLT